MPSEKEIEAAARAICEADMVLPDELSLRSGKPRWTQYVKQAKPALQAADAVRWLPISEAPRDGTHLLITEGKQIDIGWFGVDWNIDSKGEWLRGDGDDFSTGYYFTPCKPTHFQFLPTPPTQTEEI